MSLSVLFILFYTIAVNFVLALFKTNSQQYDCVFNIIDKFSKRILSILDKSIFTIIK